MFAVFLMFYLYICCTFISYYDINDYRIPNACVLALAAAAAATGPDIKAAAVPLAIFAAAALICAVSGRPVPFGAGDAKLLAAIGLVSGAAGLAFSYILASLSAGLVSAVLLILKRKTKRDRIAFGPFIVFSFMLYWASASGV